MSIKIPFTIVLTFLIAISSQAEWQVKKVPKKLSDKTLWQLHFTQGKRRIIYTPRKGSERVLNIEEKTINGRKYFVTGWSYGGRSMQFRVFDPSIKNTPLCEFISFGESSELRLNKNTLQALKVPDRLGVDNPKSLKDSWVSCRILKK
jgi:hypothetical protein